MDAETNRDLYHYGILGQRWGVRRTEAQLARNRSGTKTNLSDKAKPSRKASKGSDSDAIKKMSNEELNAIVQRMELEKRYRNLNPAKVSAGKKFVDSVINKTILPAASEASKQVLKDYIIKKSNEALGIKASSKNK